MTIKDLFRIILGWFVPPAFLLVVVYCYREFVVEISWWSAILAMPCFTTFMVLVLFAGLNSEPS